MKLHKKKTIEAFRASFLKGSPCKRTNWHKLLVDNYYNYYKTSFHVGQEDEIKKKQTGKWRSRQKFSSVVLFHGCLSRSKCARLCNSCSVSRTPILSSQTHCKPSRKSQESYSRETCSPPRGVITLRKRFQLRSNSLRNSS